jgi:hypothetical protein
MPRSPGCSPYVGLYAVLSGGLLFCLFCSSRLHGDERDRQSRCRLALTIISTSISDANMQTHQAVLRALVILTMVMLPGTRNAAAEDDPGIRVTIYPLLVKAPIFGASVNLPSLPSVPGGGGGDEVGAVDESTGVALNAAYMGALLVEANRWFAEASGTWAALSATREAPRVVVDSDAYFFGARGGVRLVGGLFASAGVRRIRTNVDLTLTLLNSGRAISGTVKPALWDPMVGVDWRSSFGAISLDANAQYGGFKVGTDVDASGEAHVRWRVIRHLELRAGYSVFHVKMTLADVTIGSFERQLVLEQTLNGPEFGFGIVF